MIRFKQSKFQRPRDELAGMAVSTPPEENVAATMNLLPMSMPGLGDC
jgi:hypothetical protein